MSKSGLKRKPGAIKKPCLAERFVGYLSAGYLLDKSRIETM
jgi:hypothetical protein